MTKEEKCSATQKGRVVIHKDNCEKRVYREELSNYLKDGWIQGFSSQHSKKNSVSHTGKVAYNKGIPCKQETKEKISKTLKSKNLSSWSKGLTKETDERIKLAHEKGIQTKIKKYGSAFPNNPMTEEHKRKIGIANKGKVSKFKGIKRDSSIGQKISKSKIGHKVSDETKDKISLSKFGKHLSQDTLNKKLDKEYQTKKKNNSFNKSNVEEEYYSIIKEEFKGNTILRQYKDKQRYPFYCDFYVVEKDLFIEVNAHWSHGGKPYDPNDLECQQQLSLWQEKAKTSQFYQNAIETWTIRDVNKQKCAKDNKLNYRVIY